MQRISSEIIFCIYFRYKLKKIQTTTENKRNNEKLITSYGKLFFLANFPYLYPLMSISSHDSINMLKYESQQKFKTTLTPTNMLRSAKEIIKTHSLFDISTLK